MKEKDFQTEFSKRNKEEGVFELKISKSKSIRFDSVSDHQREALSNANGEKGVFHKITDFPVSKTKGNKAVRFHAPKPFDCFLVRNTNAYIVVMFYEPRKKKNVYYVFIEDWLKAEENSTKKSINEDEVSEIAVLKEDYK